MRKAPLQLYRYLCARVYTGLCASWEQPHVAHQASESGVIWHLHFHPSTSFLQNMSSKHHSPLSEFFGGRRSIRTIIGTYREAHCNPAACLCCVLCYFMQILFKKKYLFIYLVLSILSCGTQDLCCATWVLSCYNTNSLVEVCRLSHSSACEFPDQGSNPHSLHGSYWTAREVPGQIL